MLRIDSIVSECRYTPRLYSRFMDDVVAAAKAALDELSADYVNGGYELVAWNHNPDAVRAYGRAFLAVGAIENGEHLIALADALDRYQLDHGELAIAADPLPHFQRFRQLRRGASAGIPEPDDELAEVIDEYLLARAR